MITEHGKISFLDKICVELGICIPPSDKQRIAQGKYETIDQLISDVFEAEGLSVELNQALFKEAKLEFKNMFGNDF